jgi:hypothetical protein
MRPATGTILPAARPRRHRPQELPGYLPGMTGALGSAGYGTRDGHRGRRGAGRDRPTVPAWMPWCSSGT